MRMRPFPLLALAVLCSLVSAQNPIQFRTNQVRVVPEHFDKVAPLGILAADIDGDGDLDLFAHGGPDWGQGGQDRLYRNDGHGRFEDLTATHFVAEQQFTESALWLDADGDGDLDLYQGNGFNLMTDDPQDRLFLNDGAGQLTDVTFANLPGDQDNTVSCAAGDVDGDGDADLVLQVGNPVGGSTVLLYRNDGSGRFLDDTLGNLPPAPVGGRLSLADLDADGDLDLVRTVANAFGTGLLLLHNDGTGAFTDVTATQLVPPIDQATDFTMLDGDGDGDLDLLCVTRGMFGNRYYQNDGQGLFTDASGSFALAKHSRVESADMNLDGQADLVLLLEPGEVFEYEVWLGTGTGSFAPMPASARPTTLFTERFRDLVLADVDGNGLTDVCLCGTPGHRAGPVPQMREWVHFGVAPGVFRRPDEPELLGVAWDGAAGDYDLDGDLDLLTLRYDATSLHRNDGKGRFVDVTASALPGVGPAKAAVFADFDGDGRADLFLAKDEYLPSVRGELWLGSPSGVLQNASSTHLPVYVATTRSVAAGDVDQDGDVDLVLGNDGSSNLLLRNDGTGRFAADAGFAGIVHSTGIFNDGVQLGDVDGDGDLDYCNLRGQQIQVFENTGNAVFVLRSTIGGLASSSIRAGRLADFDGDGLAEIFVGFHNAVGQILRQVAPWSFQGTPLPFVAAAARTWDAEAIDFDRDGDLDLAVACDYSCFLFENTPTALLDATSRWYSHGSTTSLVAADFDRDGDPDLTAFGTDGVHVFANLHVHRAALEPAQIGARFRIELSFHPGYLVAPASAWLGFSLAEADVPVPGVGILGLDLGSLVFGGPIPVPAPTGLVQVDLVLPNSPALYGVPLWGQALFFDAAGAAFLGNTLLDVIR
jgi:hypothetical protein